MAEFWNGLNVLQRIYFCIGLAATLVLVLQIITMLFGLSETDTGVDLDGDGEPDINVDTGDGFTLFSVRGVIAFFAIGGWVGYIFAETNAALAIVLSVVAGSLALVAMAFIMRGIMKMRSDGNIDIKRAVGKIADVYLTVPAKDNGNGKVTLTLEERFVELSAIQNGETPLTTGSKVKITDVSGDCVIVEKV